MDPLSCDMDSAMSAVTSLIRLARILKSSYLSNSSDPKSLKPGSDCDGAGAGVAGIGWNEKVCFSSNERTASIKRVLLAST